MSHTIELVKEALPADLTESPHWNAEKEELLYVDILGQAVFRYVPKTGECYKLPIEEAMVGFIVPVKGQAGKYLVGVGKDIKILEWDGSSSTAKSLTTLHAVEGDEARFHGNRFNDGKCDSKGRLWAGTKGPFDLQKQKLVEKNGSFYSFDGKGKVSKHFGEIDVSNGLTWSRDEKTFYYIDSYSYTLDAFDFDVERGTLCNRRPIYDLRKEPDFSPEPLLDGMTIDEDGNLWIAVFHGGKIIKVDPSTGKKLQEILFPNVKKVTALTFGGKELDILYVTSARPVGAEGVYFDPLQPNAGALFAIKGLGVKGFSAGREFVGNV